MNQITVKQNLNMIEMQKNSFLKKKKNFKNNLIKLKITVRNSINMKIDNQISRHNMDLDTKMIWMYFFIYLKEDEEL
jgi:hypothetical protein